MQTFGTGDIDGAWVPEPYASSWSTEGGQGLVDEKTLWPDGKFVTTVLLVRNDFLDEHPDLVDDLLKGQVAGQRLHRKQLRRRREGRRRLAVRATRGSPVDQGVLDTAWSHLTFSDDPVADSLIESAKHAVDVGLLEPVDNPGGIFDLDPLNAILKDAGEPEVAGPSVQ